MPPNPLRPFEVYAFHFKDKSYDNKEHTIIKYIDEEQNKHRIHLAEPNVLHIAVGEGTECDFKDLDEYMKILQRYGISNVSYMHNCDNDKVLDEEIIPSGDY